MADQDLASRDSKLPRPIVNAMLICDEASLDAKSGKITLKGIFEVIRAVGFPVRHEALAVYIKMTDAAGTYPFVFKVISLEDGRLVGTGQAKFLAKDRLAPVELIFTIGGLVFPNAGLYEFQVHADGLYLCGKTLSVQHSKPRYENQMSVIGQRSNKKNTVPGQVLNRGVVAMRRTAAFPQQFEQALSQIRALETLSEGWDSYGAAAIAPEARSRACVFLTMLATHLENRVTPPVIGPTPAGGVMLRWDDEKREVEVTFLRTGGDYSVVDRVSHDVLEGEVGSPEGVLQAVQRYVLTA